MGRPAVFLDRDGTVITDKVHLTDPNEVELLNGASGAIRRLNEAGLFTCIVTNQAVIARGWTTHERVQQANARVQQLLQVEGASIDAFYYCPDHPDFTDDCECRKPAPGMLLQAAGEHDLDLSRSFMVGDWWADIGAGDAAGTTTVLVMGAVEGKPRVEAKLAEHGLEPDHRAVDLADAVDWILEGL
jgi:D-glycero-D-manno-heptose 1,7-bisphosphate phosphatase